MLFPQLFDKESSTYTYLIADEVTKEAVLVDPVLEQVERDLEIVRELGLRLVHVLDTHVHADHVIAMNSFAGFAGALSHATIPWTLALAITGASVLGSFGGTALAGRVKPQALRAGFAWFVLGMAVWMSFKQLPDSVGARFGQSPASASPSRSR